MQFLRLGMLFILLGVGFRVKKAYQKAFLKIRYEASFFESDKIEK